MNDNLKVDTVKIKGLPQTTELENLQKKYDDALAAMLAKPTIENIKAFGDANCQLFETQDLYRTSLKLLLEFKKKMNFGRRNYTSYNETHIFIRR